MNLSYRFSVFFLFSSSLVAVGQQVFPSVLPAQPAQSLASLTPNKTKRSVALDVVVTDKSGKPISGLKAEDFTLLDDKQPQKIESFHAVDPSSSTDAPVKVI
jgi:hypothetical protein